LAKKEFTYIWEAKLTAIEEQREKKGYKRR
jgi:hypothetical protein